TWVRMASSWPAKLSSSASVDASRANLARCATSSREIWDTSEKPNAVANRPACEPVSQSSPTRRNAGRAPLCNSGRVPSYLLRIELLDRPGSLGSLAVALGSVGADILSLDVVERRSGYATDDLVIDLPPGAMPDTLITAAESLDGVRVDSVRP